MYNYSYSPSAPEPAPHRRRFVSKRSFAIFAAAVLVTLVAFHLFPHPVKADTHPQLAKELDSIITANPSVSIGVALIDLDDNDTSFTYGRITPFTAASTTKILTAASFLHGVEQGSYSLNMPLGISTASWQLQEMVNQSDNDSWSLFLELIGNAQLDAYARQNGLLSFDADSNTISPLDEARLLAKLYQHQLLNTADTSLLLSYMQNTNDETLIPAALPSGAVVYHKYGELLDTDDDGSGNFVHDAAIISYHGQHFVLAIYTDKSDDLDITTRQQIIHNITGDVVGTEEAS